jgi:hypothetical protein
MTSSCDTLRRQAVSVERQPLLPWLILGQGTQVGKSAVKGAGVYSIKNLSPNYWSGLR